MEQILQHVESIQYIHYCLRQKPNNLEDRLILFVGHLANKMFQFGTIKSYVSAIRTRMHSSRMRIGRTLTVFRWRTSPPKNWRPPGTRPDTPPPKFGGNPPEKLETPRKFGGTPLGTRPDPPPCEQNS